MKHCIALGLAVAAIASVRAADGTVLVDRHAYLMGTQVRLAALHSTRAGGLQLLDRALDVLEAAESELSTWRSDSAVTALNRTPVGEAWQAGASVCTALRIIAEWHLETDGAFDPAIGRLLETWDVHGQGRLPTAAEIEQALSSSGFGQIAFDSRRCRVTRTADVTLDAGAWGKGEALDRAARVLGGAPWMINLGGQIAAHAPPGEDGWPVAIAHPLDRKRGVLTAKIREGSLATSGGSERDLAVDGARIGHVLDPRTGRPAAFTGSVTVWHPRALVADILSTALYVMGPDAGLPWAEARGLSACYLVVDAGGRVRTVMTPAFRRIVLSTDV